MLLLFVICCLLIAPLYVLYKPPAALIRYFQRRWPDVLWQVPTSKKLITLTIDDGPSEYTDEILEVLQADNATATFFIIGSHVSGREKTLKDLVLANTELDNHAMHDEPARSLRDVDLVAQIEAVGRMIRSLYEAAGIAPPLNYFRPGSGFVSTRMRKIVANWAIRWCWAVSTHTTPRSSLRTSMLDTSSACCGQGALSSVMRGAGRLQCCGRGFQS